MPNLPPKAKGTRAKSAENGDLRNLKIWQDCRTDYKRLYPICQRCQYFNMVDDRSTKNLEVHHIKALETGKTRLEQLELLVDFNNLLTLCKTCHDKFSALERLNLFDEAEQEGQEIKGFLVF